MATAFMAPANRDLTAKVGLKICLVFICTAFRMILLGLDKEPIGLAPSAAPNGSRQNKSKKINPQNRCRPIISSPFHGPYHPYAPATLPIAVLPGRRQPNPLFCE
jgi:hypothetical protein